MKSQSTANLLSLAATLAVALIPLHAQASPCSTAVTAGKWAYTYTGSVFTPNGPVPAASVGHRRVARRIRSRFPAPTSLSATNSST